MGMRMTEGINHKVKRSKSFSNALQMSDAGDRVQFSARFIHVLSFDSTGRCLAPNQDFVKLLAHRLASKSCSGADIWFLMTGEPLCCRLFIVALSLSRARTNGLLFLFG